MTVSFSRLSVADKLRRVILMTCAIALAISAAIVVVTQFFSFRGNLLEHAHARTTLANLFRVDPRCHRARRLDLRRRHESR